MLVIVIFIKSVILLTTNAKTYNVFKSISYVENQLETQAQIIVSLEQFISKEKKYNMNIDIVKKYLKHCKEEHSLALKDVERYLGNPINAYSLIKRLTLDLNYVEQLIGNSTVYKRISSVKYPTMSDLNSATANFFLIQMVYQLNVTQLASGVLAGHYSRHRRPFVENVTPMSISDCLELGITNYINRDYDRNVAWLKEALRKLDNHSYDVSNITRFDVMYHLVCVYTVMLDFDSATIWMNKVVDMMLRDPNYSDVEERHGHLIKKLVQRMENAKKDVAPKKEEEDAYFQVYDENVASYCRGENSTLLQNNSRPLTCVYAYWPDPFLVLARVKAEFLNYDPPVTLYHEVVSDSEIENLKLMAKRKIAQDNELRQRISRRIEQFTGLSTESADSQFLIDYGLREHYVQNDDLSSTSNKQCGDRAATVMLFWPDIILVKALLLDAYFKADLPTEEEIVLVIPI